MKNGAFTTLSSPMQQRALPEVVEHQGRQHQAQPRQVIGARPKWPMSAYSASAPVTDSTTAASAKKAMWKWPAMNSRAYSGDSARRICGWPDDAAHAADADDDEPHDHHRAEEPAHRRGAVALHRNSPMMMTAVIGHHEFGQSRDRRP